jgi:hypothetical protein
MRPHRFVAACVTALAFTYPALVPMPDWQAGLIASLLACVYLLCITAR